MSSKHPTTLDRVIVLDPGEDVICDSCSEDFSDSPDCGGFIFLSSAYCPTCSTKALPSIRRYEEEHLVRARANDGETFADFVRRYRSGVES